MVETIRLDKYLADMGCGTRSEVKQMIIKEIKIDQREKGRKSGIEESPEAGYIVRVGKKSMKNTGICCFTNQRVTCRHAITGIGPCWIVCRRTSRNLFPVGRQ